MQNPFSKEGQVQVIGARAHNLKNIDVSFPRNSLVVITGLSGSGKSSLAFDTIYAEGQRRYIETFSSYARQFLGTLERPDVDKIEGLSPVISIEQKTVSKNPRSTVGTITEVYDFLRLLYARAGTAYSYNTGKKMVKYTENQLIGLLLKQFEDKKISILAPVVRGRKGHYRELFEQMRNQGFIRARINGEIEEITHGLRVDRYKTHNIEIVVDRLSASLKNEDRIKKSVQLALHHGKGSLFILDEDTGETTFFSKNLMCPDTGIAYDDPAPNLFSFNSPYGACQHCNGLGRISKIDIDKIIPNRNQTIKKGGIAPLGEYKNSWTFRLVESLLKNHGYTITQQIKEIPEEVINKVLYGADEYITVESISGVNQSVNSFEGIISILKKQLHDSPKAALKRWAESFMNLVDCPECKGTRLQQQSLNFKIADYNIAELATMDIGKLHDLLSNDVIAKMDGKQQIIASEILKEINERLTFMLDVGLDYLTLNRPAASLSGGEGQRIRLATQIGSQLVNVLYILDEPSIGLHQRDNHKLIESLKQLRDNGNSVLVVEHDKDMMLESDYIIDMGPGAGRSGGQVTGQGTPQEFLKLGNTTAQYLSGSIEIPVPTERREGNGKFLELTGATGNNLKEVDLQIPLGKFVCVTGVSGSGKSTLINKTLYPVLSQYFYRSVKEPEPHNKVKGIEHIDKVIEIDQSPIGRTPRSNPATYTGVFTEIRNLFAITPEAKIRGYKPGRFSFNVKGGRCETCKGAGLKTIEMNFLPDVFVECDTCNGKRYNRETLEVRYKGKSIYDVLEMNIEKAVDFFEEIPKIYIKLKTLNEVGLGYLTLGQASTTLSGGEAQRVKLASELSKKSTGNTLYILDEPTTGLHFEDIKMLIEVLNQLVDGGNTVIVIEHNMDIIKVADHIIDLGPEGGDLGGYIMATGTPEALIKEEEKSYTARFLKEEM